jgi:hypothetical protein
MHAVMCENSGTPICVDTKQLSGFTRVMTMSLHIFRAHPEWPKIPAWGFEAEDNALPHKF